MGIMHRKCPSDENSIGTVIVEEALRLHKALGCGLFESVYEVTLAHALRKRGSEVERQVPIAITYDDCSFDEGFRADLLVDNKVIVELKSIERLNPIHKKQLITYLKLTELKVGYLLNFGSELMKDGIVRVINGTLDAPASSPSVPPCLRAKP